jgi:hypothetical protein
VCIKKADSLKTTEQEREGDSVERSRGYGEAGGWGESDAAVIILNLEFEGKSPELLPHVQDSEAMVPASVHYRCLCNGELGPAYRLDPAARRN